ncbi:PIN domain-containing protein [Sediminispirochaeta smaragdinae]|uniref:hypothetical protein n=1 Tax=Sediminispirochaeta smaragdinae TaxID=55206 RepID=UPI0002DF8264|nr:hypothetical protein [Sediminispirochaeta smaragdinae]
MIVVLDPSAAVEILLKRNNSTILQRLLIEAETVISPDLYIAEISNVAWKYYKLANILMSKRSLWLKMGSI